MASLAQIAFHVIISITIIIKMIVVVLNAHLDILVIMIYNYVSNALNFVKYVQIKQFVFNVMKPRHILTLLIIFALLALLGFMVITIIVKHAIIFNIIVKYVIVKHV